MVTLSNLGAAAELALRSVQPNQNGPTATSQPGGDFASMLGKLAGETASTLRQGEAAALSGITGGLPLQTVVDRVMAAERTLQTAIAVRDKVVSAYLEISRMQI